MKSLITKHTLFLREGDFARLREVYPNIGAGPIVRKIVSRFVDNLDSAGLSPEDLKALEAERE